MKRPTAARAQIIYQWNIVFIFFETSVGEHQAFPENQIETYSGTMTSRNVADSNQFASRLQNTIKQQQQQKSKVL